MVRIYRTHGEMRHGYTHLNWKTQAKIIVTTEIDLKEICDEGLNWIQVTQDRVHLWILVNTATNSGLDKRWKIF
jgi:hypothetical protein